MSSSVMYSIDKIEDLMLQLDELPDLSKTRLDKNSALKTLKQSIKTLKKKGYTADEICQKLIELGMSDIIVADVKKILAVRKQGKTAVDLVSNDQICVGMTERKSSTTPKNGSESV